MSYQENIAKFPVDKIIAREKAHFFVKEKYGNIPSIGEPILENNVWNIPIEARYPRIRFDEITNMPKKVRYMKFDNIGFLKIDANYGTVIEKSRSWDVRTEIQRNLEFIQNNVQKALVKCGADKFSKLPFSEHMHTPVIDILSYLLINEYIDINEVGESFTEKDDIKYKKIMDILLSMNLIRESDDSNRIYPGNILIEIESSDYINEESGSRISDKLSQAMAYFFANGYEHLDSINMVLGAHLSISGYIYQQGIEYNEIVPVRTDDIFKFFRTLPNSFHKLIKIPRYLIQLDKVGIIKLESHKGEDVWLPENNIFEDVLHQERLLTPINGMFL